MFQDKHVQQILAMMSEHIEIIGRNEMINFAKKKKWSEAELVVLLQKNMSDFKRRNKSKGE